jgi:hypothetical protein
VIAERLDGFDHDEYGESVVHRFAGDEVAHLLEVAVHRHHVADLDSGLGVVAGHADVDEEVIHRFGAFGFAGAEEVLRLGGHHEEPGDGAVLGVDDDALAGQLPEVEASQGVQAQEPFVFDVLDHEADLVHVGGDHHLRADAAFGRLLRADEVAHRVDAEVAQVAEFVGDDLADFVFLARNAAGFAEAPQQVDVHR